MYAPAYATRASVASPFVSQNTVVSNNAVTRIEDNAHVARVLTHYSERDNQATKVANRSDVTPRHTLCVAGDVAIMILDENDVPINESARNSSTFDSPLPLVTTCIGGLQHYTNYRTVGVIRAGPGIGGTGRNAVSVAFGGAVSIINTGKYGVAIGDELHAIIPLPDTNRRNIPEGQLMAQWDGIARPMIISRDRLLEEARGYAEEDVFTDEGPEQPREGIVDVGEATRWVPTNIPVFAIISALIRAPTIANARAAVRAFNLYRQSKAVYGELCAYLRQDHIMGFEENAIINAPDIIVFNMALQLQNHYLERTRVGYANERKQPGEPVLTLISRA